MANLPASINGVAVQFGPKVNRTVKQSMIKGLKHCIKTDIATGSKLNKIYISSASDQHKLPSRHAQEKAVDISRINGTKIVIGYPQGGDAKAIVDAIQDTFETYSGRRENYGPKFKKKSGNPHPAKDHKDHIHLSVN